jgi:polyisoprenoid-binding protein YceI
MLAAAALTAPAWAADTYTIDPVSSIPSFQVVHLGYTTQRGRFDHVAGKITLDPSAHKGVVDLTIYTSSLDMGSPGWTAHLEDEGLFNVLKFPEITFKSDRLTFDGDRVVAADGMLTIIGVARPVHVVVQRFRCGPHPQTKQTICGADITAALKRSEFGLTKYLDAVGDEVRIDAPVLAYKN